MSFPLLHKFRTALGEKNVTKNVVVRLECSNGICGYGEASSSLAMPEASQSAMVSTLKKIGQYVKKSNLEDWQDIAETIYKKFNQHPTAVSAMECSLLDAFCRMKKISLAQYFGAKSRAGEYLGLKRNSSQGVIPAKAGIHGSFELKQGNTMDSRLRGNDKQKGIHHPCSIETYYTIPALPPKICEKILKTMTQQGFKKFKVKVTGKDPIQDFERIRLVHEYASKSSVILDANQSWTPYSAVRFLDRLIASGFLISLVEQPVFKQDIQGLKFIKESLPVPIAADESFRTLKDVQKIAEADAADVFNIKLAKTGLMEALRIVKYVQKIKKKLMIGCMMESPIGLSAGIHWACGSGIFEWADLDSFLLLKPLNNIHAGFNHKGPKIWIKKNVLGSGTSFYDKGVISH